MKPILEGINIKKYFQVSGGFLSKSSSYVRAVDGVNISIYPSEVLALVGESGSGKSTLGRVLIGISKPTEGKVLFNGKDIYFLKGDEKIKVRHSLQIIFQNPDSSLNPRMQVLDILGEAVKEKNPELSRIEVIEHIIKLLEAVGLNPDHIYKYPHELSGGEKQRIAIARALAMEPKVIVADEPVSALDVSIRAQILNLLMDIQRKLKLSMLFIAHDLGIVWNISDKVAVMYLGKIVEYADTEELFENPLHPYTMILLSSAPILSSNFKKFNLKPRGEPPSPINPPSGCRFHTRCPFAKDKCKGVDAKLIKVSNNHYTACPFYANL